MVTQKTNFDLVCENMVVVNPEIPVGTFDFDKMDQAIGAAYQATMEQMPEIFSMVDRRVTLKERNTLRKEFWDKQADLVFDDITFSGIDKTQKSYLKRIINKKDDEISIEQLKRKYFKVFSDDKIKSIYPTTTLNSNTQSYGLHLNVKKEKDLFLEVGGIYSSRPINTGYIGLKYNLFGKTSSTIWANSYFGKFYGSVSVGTRFDFAGAIPFSIEPNLVFNRWDYFTSFATFFEDVQPSFIVVNERFGGLKFKFPVRNKGRIEMNFDYAEINDNYYQSTQFLPVDTADRTRLIVQAANVRFDRNTLNKKQYPNKGTRLSLEGKMLSGEEQTIPGSTSAISDTTYNQREWVTLKMTYTNYFQKLGLVKLGFHLEGVGSTQPFMRNHVSTLISAPAFQPIPESRTFFINAFRAHNYAAGGLMIVASISKSIDWRGEGYIFNPFGSIESSPDGGSWYDWGSKQYYVGSSSLVYHSPLGPLSFSVNYYDQKEKPWSVVLNFGYIIFNRSVRNI